MLAKDIVQAIQAEPLSIWNNNLLNKDYSMAFASDLMSDALAMIQNYPESTILITGLCNSQVLRTAEMLDIEMIIFVRGKKLPEESLEIAAEMGFNIFTTEYTMYETCGILFGKGLGGIRGSHTS
ncbi:MAG: hypothetical protein IJJ44_07095 [Solobacterium sp.]|nr:hypothetical protein [Solobacterium sp.]MBQ6222360.1 hypothetical protein [Solobacterium sp.]MBR2669352.1 hypothetical protein [Solobacterium sp.]